MGKARDHGATRRRAETARGEHDRSDVLVNGRRRERTARGHSRFVAQQQSPVAPPRMTIFLDIENRIQ
jgi:hypothetical protein